tara:strand:- start:4091 stop:6571 length:2481 start_codon:yes stop_codon:yes gene_type:complete
MSKDKINKLTDAQREYNAEIKRGESLYREFQGTFESIAGELGKQVSETKRAAMEYSKLVSISKKLAENEEDISRLSDKQLAKYKSSAIAAAEEVKRIVELVSLKQKQGIQLNEEEKSLLLAKKENFIQEESLVGKITEEIAGRERSNEAMGVAGNLLSSLNTMAGGFSKALKLDKVEKDMRAVADSIKEGGEQFGKMKVLAAGVGSAVRNLADTLTDPSVVLGAIAGAFKELGKSQREFRKVTGQNAEQFSALNGSLALSTEQIETMTELSKELGVNANIFDEDTIVEVTELTKQMGMGAHEAAQLAKFAKLSGQELSTVTGNMESSFTSFVKTNKVGINISDVMNDVGSASAAVTLSLGSQPGLIQDAAMEARKLGLSLEQVDKIAGSLLDFESSIQAEMEAEMLIGKEINLDKARQLALNNDLKGVAKELGNNQAVLKAFSSGNRIQQDATARAMGMSREEMAKMIYQQKIQSGLTTEQAAKVADISLDEAKRLSTTEQITKSLNKLAQAAASVLDFFSPIVANVTVLALTLTSVAFILGAKILIALKGSVAEMKTLGKEALSFLKTTGLIEKVKSGFGSLFGAKPKQSGIPFMSAMNKAAPTGPMGPINKAGGAIGGLTDSTKGVKPGMGKMIQSFLTGIGKGLAALGKAVMGPQLAGIAAGMAILTLSLMGIGAALGMAAPAFKAFGTIITSIFGGVATVIAAVAVGIVTIMESMTMEKIKPMFLLGTALFGIAGGLAAMAVAGLGALPIIGALGALSLVAAPLAALAGVFGGGGDEGNGGEDKIAKKLDELIDIAKKGTVIMMDGNVVGQTVQRASSGIGT